MGWVEALFPGVPGWAHTAFRILFWALAVAAMGFGLAAVYRYGPNRPDALWVWISPGSAFAALLWLAGSLGFGVYVSNFGNYNATYGSLGGVVVFLTWLYLSAYIVLIGGELNSELERQQAKKAGVPLGDTNPSLGAASGETDRSEPAFTGAPPAPEDGGREHISWPMAAMGLVLSRLR
jgi:membrane protein